MLETAIEAARAAGAILDRYFEMTGLEREQKVDTTFVTKADKEAEAIIVDIIRRTYPDHGIRGEEGADVNPDAPYQWLVDPLDGTGNFINGVPLFAVSIALTNAGVPQLGVVYNPVTDSLYAAEKGKGTTYNGKPVRVSDQPADKGLLTFAITKKKLPDETTLLAASYKAFDSVRILGCCALELGYVARGGSEAVISLGLKTWDYAAGQLLIQEAGGTVTDYEGNPSPLEENRFLASNGVSHDALLALARTIHQ